MVSSSASCSHHSERRGISRATRISPPSRSNMVQSCVRATPTSAASAASSGRTRSPDRHRVTIDVLVDADVLGRQRTGDETYVENLLRRLPEAAPELRFAAVTRHPLRVPEGIEALELAAGSQALRMAWQQAP